MATILDTVRCYAEAHSDTHGVARTPIHGFAVIRETLPGALQYSVNRPLVALVLQGRKRVTIGASAFEFGAGESLLITTDVPTVSQITCASPGVPYLAVVVDLDPVTIEELVIEMGTTPFAAGEPVRVDPTDEEVSDAVLRLLRLLDRPASLPVLHKQLMRELHFWLLSGRHGGAIRCLGVTDSYARRIGRAVAVIRMNYAAPLRIGGLAAVAGMSTSTFHEHFRAITSVTPLQLQKRFRLIEARRMLLSDGARVGYVAHTVGYESVQQFTREYGRLFGLPPARDVKAADAVRRLRPPTGLPLSSHLTERLL